MNIIRSLFQRRHTSEREFQKVMKVSSARMLEYVQSVVSYQLEISSIDRSLLDYLKVESSSVEELLDSANAQGNRYWYPYRRAVAFLKNFSHMGELLLYVEEISTESKLLPVEGDFAADTRATLKSVRELLVSGCNYAISEAQKHNIYKEMPLVSVAHGHVATLKRGLALPMTRHVRHDSKPALTVIALATKFLQLSERNTIFDPYANIGEAPALSTLVPEVLNPEDVRLLQTHFHNMQSVYDTFIYGSDVNIQNPNISLLNNHITLIFKLLQIATLGVHYFQRHVHEKMSTCLLKSLELPHALEHLDKIVAYSLSYADHFRKVARSLCQDMLKQYAEPGKIDVPVPNYRGFHVRPSTLIARIVAHYGSDVIMKLDDISYDAKMPLELFRANEDLNAQKRRQMLRLLSENSLLQGVSDEPVDLEQRKTMARDVILDMFEKKQIVLYDRDFSFADVSDMENENYFDFLKRVLVRYMATGKIDAQIEARVTFEGDKRVLQDIQILADHGYGEDIYGNNIVLPTQLQYLRA